MARYSGRGRPAWRVDHTGTWSWGSPRQARRNGESTLTIAARLLTEASREASRQTSVVGGAGRTGAPAEVLTHRRDDGRAIRSSPTCLDATMRRSIDDHPFDPTL